MSKKKTFSHIQDQIGALRDFPERDPVLAADSKAEFLALAERLREQGIKSPAPKKQPQQPRGRKRWMPAAVGILAAVLLALGSVGGTVYASQDSLPDDFLYPVKTFVEDTQLRLEQDPEDLLDLETRFAKRRVEEINALIDEGKEIPEKTQKRLESHVDHMLRQATRMRNQGKGQGMDQAQQALQVINQVMINLQTNNPGKSEEALNRVQNKIQQGLENTGTGSQKPHNPPGQEQESSEGMKQGQGQEKGNSNQAPGQQEGSQPGQGKPEDNSEGEENQDENHGNAPDTPPGQDPEFNPGNGSQKNKKNK